MKEYQKMYREKNKERLSKLQKNRRDEHPDRVKKLQERAYLRLKRNLSHKRKAKQSDRQNHVAEQKILQRVKKIN